MKFTDDSPYKQAPAGMDVWTEVRFTPKDYPAGKVVPISVDGREVLVLIPVSAKDGTTIKVSEKGRYDPQSGKTGDLYVSIHIEKKPLPWRLILIPVLLALSILCAVVLLQYLLPVVRSLLPAPSGAPTSSPATIPTSVQTPTTGSCAHVWLPAGCEEYPRCSLCGASSDAVTDHQWTEATYNAPKTCTVCGATEGEKKTPGTPLGLRDMVSDVRASSVYSGDDLGTHSPMKLFDGKLDTNWTENVSGTGIGESVTFVFDSTYAVNKLRIHIGSHYNKTKFLENCRPSMISLTFSDGSVERIQLKDTYEEQIIMLSQFFYTDYIILTIEDVYMGTDYTDTVIAELNFTGYRP